MDSKFFKRYGGWIIAIGVALFWYQRENRRKEMSERMRREFDGVDTYRIPLKSLDQGVR